MKFSHYKTPRTLAECEFSVDYPIHAFRHRRHFDSTSIYLWGAIVVIVVLAIGRYV